VRNEENKQLFTGVFILQLLEQRYLIERYPISKNSHYYDCVLPELPLSRHEAISRMSPEIMHLLVGHHEVFHNNGRNSQHSVSLQTVVAVRRLAANPLVLVVRVCKYYSDARYFRRFSGAVYKADYQSRSSKQLSNGYGL